MLPVPLHWRYVISTPASVLEQQDQQSLQLASMKEAPGPSRHRRGEGRGLWEGSLPNSKGVNVPLLLAEWLQPFQYSIGFDTGWLALPI